MKSLDHPPIGSRAAMRLSAAPGFVIACFTGVTAVLAVALPPFFFSRFPSFAAPFAQAGITTSIAVGLLCAVRKTVSQRRRLVSARTGRHD